MNRFLEYLTVTRGLTLETIKAFELGWYDSNSSESYFESDNQELSTIVSKLDSRFEDSILFPIYDLYHQPVGITARPIIKKEKQTRYINTVYDKGKHLFGLYNNYKEILKEGKAILVEGNFDMLSLWDKGIRNVVALLGGSFSFYQLCLLLRFTEEIVICGDGDKAGRSMSQRVENFCNGRGVIFRILNLPEGKDPDSYVREFGKESFLNLIERDPLLCI